MWRVFTSYKLMLDFFGMRLEDEASGLISRSRNYATQYRNLRSTYFCPNLVLQSRPVCLAVRFTRTSAASRSHPICPSIPYVRRWANSRRFCSSPSIIMTCDWLLC